MNPLLHVAIIGAGPSGFYAAEALIKSAIDIKIDMFERLPSPYGLVRNGVAPDHPKLKRASLLYDQIAANKQYDFFGNIRIGQDISVATLQQAYHALIFCCGAEADRNLGIPGESLTGSHTAADFVGWYNGHPDHRKKTFDLSHEVAVVIGQGNVAADIGRILSKTADELRHTDIAQHALEALAESKIRQIYVIGRRGPVQARFTAKELKEFGELNDCVPIVHPEELRLNPASQTELTEESHAENKKTYAIFQSWVDAPPKKTSRRCCFQFLRSPVEIYGHERIETIRIMHNTLKGKPFQQTAHGNGETYTMELGLLLNSIGRFGIPIQGLPFDAKRGIIPNEQGRIMVDGQGVPQLYTAGWSKRGANGVIATNRSCSAETVQCLLADQKKLHAGDTKKGFSSIYPLLEKRGIQVVDFDQWKQIDRQEIANGQAVGKPREKYTTTHDMLSQL